MALTFNWPIARRQEGALSNNALWLVAGVAMAGLAACVNLLTPEQSLAIMVGLLIFLLAVADLRWAFLAFVILYPFIPSTWGIDVAAWMPYLTAKRLGCLALAVTFFPFSKEAWDTPRVKRVACFLLGLMAVQTLVGFGSPDPLGAVKGTFGDAVEMYLPFLIGAHLFRTKAQVRVLVTVVLISMTAVAVLAIIEHTIDYNFYSSFVAVREDIQIMLTQATESYRGGDIHARRVRVAFNHPIELGLHLMCIFFMVVYLLRQRGILPRLFLLASLPLFTLALLYTYSRGPMLGLVCGLVWLSLIARGTRTLLVWLLLCSLGGYLLMPAQSRDVLEQTIASSADIGTADSIGGGTVRARLDLLEAGLQFSQKNIWFGLGPEEVRQHKVNGSMGGTVNFSSVDNFYLQTLLRHGVIVLALTVGFYFYLLVLFTGGALRLADRELALLAAIAASMCVANFVALVTVGINITLFWILLGPALRAADLNQGTVGRPARRRHGGFSAGSPLPPGRTRSKQTMDHWPAGSQQRQRVPVAEGEHALAPWVSASYGVSGRLFRRAMLRSASVVPMILLVAAAAAAPAQAAPSFYGTTGLFATPTAAVSPHGAWSLGSNYVGRDFRPGASSISRGTVANYFTLTMFPRLEMTVVLTNYEGKFGGRILNHGLSNDFNLGGLTVDRTASAQWLALPQRGFRPSLAFGVRDFLGRSVKDLHAQYAVMSLKRSHLTLSAGVGTLALRGPFGGAEYALTPRVSAIAEGLHGQADGGLRLVPLRDVQMDMALMGFRSLGGGLSYRRRF